MRPLMKVKSATTRVLAMGFTHRLPMRRQRRQRQTPPLPNLPIAIRPISRALYLNTILQLINQPSALLFGGAHGALGGRRRNERRTVVASREPTADQRRSVSARPARGPRSLAVGTAVNDCPPGADLGQVWLCARAEFGNSPMQVQL